jgi:hypothetical protein
MSKITLTLVCKSTVFMSEKKIINFIEMDMCAVLKYSSSVENRFLLPAYYQANIE